MSEEELGFLRLGGFAAALAMALLWQRLSPHGQGPGSIAVNSRLWLVNVVVTGAVCGACVCSAARWAMASGIGLFNLAAAPLWVVLPLSVLFLDFVSYAWHRANHAVPFLWRWHQVHHSDPSFSVSTALRFHPGELLLSLPVRLVAVVVAGIPAEAVVFFEILFTLANAVEHGDIDLPRGVERRLERVLVTPALHRWHHTVGVPDRDSNFATVFSLWDRAFGTLAPSDSARKVTTGLPGMVGGVTLREALLLPLHRAAD
ncbi:MAG: sterol desaturase family protein [Candidatus Binatia bacterium]